MKNKVFGISAYLENFDKEYILKFPKGTLVFLSLHIPEDIARETFKEEALEAIKFIVDNGYELIGDISPMGLEKLGLNSPEELVDEFNITYIRLDYGYENEVEKLSQKTSVIVNASTIKELDKLPENTIYMHNFYPRKDTALDQETFDKLNIEIKKEKGKIFTFIPGDIELRGPIHEKLCTLEYQRYENPFVNFLKSYRDENIDGVFIADPKIDDKYIDMINKFISEEIITIPSDLPEEYCNKVLRLRSDSGMNVHRISSLRSMLSEENKTIEPNNCVERPVGTVTIDNVGYKRYMGELQLVRNDLESDPRVNVIGKISESFIEVLEPFDKILFTK